MRGLQRISSHEGFNLRPSWTILGVYTIILMTSIFGVKRVHAAQSSRSLRTSSTNTTSTHHGNVCRAVIDVDLWGADIAHSAGVPTAGRCCMLCFQNPECFRWAWIEIRKACYLKRETGWIRKPTKGIISGRAIRSSQPSSSGTVPILPPPSSVPSPNPPQPIASPILSPIPSNGSFTRANYGDVLGLSWLFYEAQRSGELPLTGYRIPWRRSAHVNDVVPGGWYDAGDYLKLNFPLASSVSYLAWGLLEFADGYNIAGQTQYATTNLFAAVDYLKRSHIGTRKYIGQIGNPAIDHNYWGRADQEMTPRPAFVYSQSMKAADLYGKVAAALASASILWQSINASYSQELLNHAQEMYSWGVETPGKYSSYYKSATASIYPSTTWQDEMAWAAYWLYRATGVQDYLNSSVYYWRQRQWDVTIDWDNCGAAVAVALANLADDGVPVPYSSEISQWTFTTFLDAWLRSDGYQQIVKTPMGMSHAQWSTWGNLGQSTTAAFVALVRALHLSEPQLQARTIAWARSQIDYALGSSGRSFVVGYGNNPPQREQHAGASCPDRPAPCGWAQFDSKGPNPQILYGGLVGGPKGPGDNTYHDVRSDYVTNEVANDYNAGFTGALAALVQLL